MHRECAETVADIGRERNAQASLSSRVPPEVWCLIWRLLPPESVLYVARVCSSWRSIALRDRRLWTRCYLEADVRHPTCDCRNHCAESEHGAASDEDANSVGPSNAVHPDPGSNLASRAGEEDGGESEDGFLDEYTVFESRLGHIRLFAHRSGILPLTVRLALAHHKVDIRVVPRLAELLAAYAHRISTLRVDFDNVHVMRSLLRRVNALPELRALSLDLTDARYNDRIYEVPDIPFPEMPSLRKLHFVTRTLEWWGPGRNLTTVEILITALTELVNFVYIMESCPGLKTLRAKISCYPADWEQETWDRVAAWLGGLREIKLETELDWTWVNTSRLFAQSGDVVVLDLDLHDDSDPETLAVLSHLNGAIRLHWTIADNWIRVSAYDAESRSRRVALFYDKPALPTLLERAWTELVGATIEVLETDAADTMVHVLRTAAKHPDKWRNLSEFAIGAVRMTRPELEVWASLQTPVPLVLPS